MAQKKTKETKRDRLDNLQRLRAVVRQTTRLLRKETEELKRLGWIKKRNKGAVLAAGLIALLIDGTPYLCQ